MDTSEDIDRERRRVKKKRSTWAKALMRPQTFRTLVAVGKLIAEAIRVFHELYKVLRE
jgi:hypothetical protein